VKDPSDLYIHLAFRSRWCAVLAALFAQVEGKQSCNIPNRLTGNHARLVGCWWNTLYNFLSQCLEDCVWHRQVTAAGNRLLDEWCAFNPEHSVPAFQMHILVPQYQYG